MLRRCLTTPAWRRAATAVSLATAAAGVAAAGAAEDRRAWIALRLKQCTQPPLHALVTLLLPRPVWCLDWRGSAAYQPAAVDDSLFSPDQLAVLASTIADMVDIPMLPEAAERFVILKTLAILSNSINNDLPDALRLKLRNALGDQLTPQETDDLTASVAAFVSSKVHLPFLHDNEKTELIQRILTALLTLYRDISDPGHFTARGLLQGAAGVAHVLLEPQQRNLLAEHITQQYPLPFVSREEEQKVVETVIQTLSQRVNGLLPHDFVMALRGASDGEVKALKERLVKRLMETAKISMLSPNMQEALYRSVVDVMLEGIASSSGPAFLEDAETRLAKAKDSEAHIKSELTQFEDHAQARRRLLRQQLRQVQAERWELQKQTSWLAWLIGYVWFW